MKQYKSMIAGIPVQVAESNAQELGGDIIWRAKQYFGKAFGKLPHCNARAASYIDNYLALSKLDDEEYRRQMAWEFTKNTMKVSPDAVRPDLIWMTQPKEKAQPTMRIRFIKLLDKCENGWVPLRLLMNLEWHEEWTTARFFDDVIAKYDIDHFVKNTYKDIPVIRVNAFDFAQKYYCEKYKISFEEIDI